MNDIEITNIASKGKYVKRINKERFLELFDGNKFIHPHKTVRGKIVTKDGYLFECESSYERIFISKLNKCDGYELLRGDCLVIPSKKKNNYFPDMIILTKDGYVVVVEIKEIGMMVSKENRSKYNRLKNYCENNGYYYMMCDKDFYTFEDLSEIPRSPKLQKQLSNLLKKNKKIVYDDYKDLKDEYKEETLRKGIAVFVLDNDLHIRGDLSFNIKHLYIREKKTSKQLLNILS